MQKVCSNQVSIVTDPGMDTLPGSSPSPYKHLCDMAVICRHTTVRTSSLALADSWMTTAAMRPSCLHCYLQCPSAT